jgi:Tol biopolymer transport system component
VRIIYYVFIVVLVGCALPNDNKIFSSNTLVFTPTPSLVTTGISGWAVYSMFTNNSTVEENIFLKDLNTGETKQLTDSGKNSDPKWSPDGNRIMFLSWTETNQYDINIMDKTGGNRQAVLSTAANERMADWSPDGEKILYVSDKEGNDDIYIINLETLAVARLTNFSGRKLFPAWSSDGTRIVFASSVEDDRLQIFSMDINGNNVRQLTTFDLDNFDKEPIWCPDDSCIVFTRLAGPAKLMSLDLNTMKETSLLGDIFKMDNNELYDEGGPARSPVRGYLTFSVRGMYYAMDFRTKEIFPLYIQALDLSLYP